MALTLYQFLASGYELGDRSLRTRLRYWRRDRRWYSKRSRPGNERWYRGRSDDSRRL